MREVSIKLYLSYDFFSLDRHDRYDDMETRLYVLRNAYAHVHTVSLETISAFARAIPRLPQPIVFLPR